MIETWGRRDRTGLLPSQPGLPCPIGYAHDAEIERRILQGGIPEYISTPDNLESIEPGVRQLVSKLCLQQSAGDSTGP